MTYFTVSIAIGAFLTLLSKHAQIPISQRVIFYISYISIAEAIKDKSSVEGC
jgi:hypothetical protein